MGRKKANRQAFKEAGAMLTEAYLQGFSLEKQIMSDFLTAATQSEW